ncbi:MAG: MmcQ/YjbR family DNA-binding protein [Gemmatimonadaceae bacterium]|nr:MmcQ/YjbR family DNA-binding protein [Gemmatimonadaceae bacterium]
MTFDDVVRLAGELPGVETGTSYGTPALKVKAKLFARMREDGTTLVLKVPFVVREHLLSSEPAAFYITDHYRNYPYILVRLGIVRRTQLRELMEEAWRQVAPPRLVAEFDAR